MNLSDLAVADLVTLSSAHGATETVERLTALLARKGIELFAHIDHAAAARKVGLTLRPTQVLIFGNPQAGTPLMQAGRPSASTCRCGSWSGKTARARSG